MLASMGGNLLNWMTVLSESLRRSNVFQASTVWWFVILHGYLRLRGVAHESSAAAADGHHLVRRIDDDREVATARAGDERGKVQVGLLYLAVPLQTVADALLQLGLEAARERVRGVVALAQHRLAPVEPLPGDNLRANHEVLTPSATASERPRRGAVATATKELSTRVRSPPGAHGV